MENVNDSNEQVLEFIALLPFYPGNQDQRDIFILTKSHNFDACMDFFLEEKENSYRIPGF